MRAEGDCPHCGNTLGVQVSDSIATMMGDSIRRLMDRRGNGMRCPGCEEYVDPEDMEIIENH